MIPRTLVAIALAGCVTAACAPRDTPQTGAKGGDGTLRLSFIGEPQSLNPNLNQDEPAMIVGQNVFNKLVSLAADGSVLPDLATAWDERPDGLTYTFHLRDGVAWHDGRPLTAEDVRTTFVRVAAESNNADLASRIAGVHAIDARTVAIRLKAPWAAFITSLAWFGTSILPAHVYGQASWKDHPANAHPIGTGPFRFRQWDRGQRIVLDKNVAYFGPGPYVDTLEFLFARTGDEGVDRMIAGNADLLVGRPPSTRFADLARAPGIRVITAPAEGRTYLGFNLRRPAFQDLRIRRAIALALDRRALIQGPLSGLGAPAVGFYTPTIAWAYNADARVPPHDPAEALRLVRAAAPRGLEATLVCPDVGSARPLTAEIARQLAAVGIRLTVECLPRPDYMRRLFGDRDFDLAMMSGSQGPDPDNLAVRYGSTGAFQFMGYANAEVDAELARAAGPLDPASRARAYYRVQALLATDLPVVPLVEGVRVSVLRQGVRGLPQEDARGLVPDYSYSLVRLPGSGG